MKKIIVALILIVVSGYFYFNRQPQQAKVKQAGYSKDIVAYFEKEDDPQKIAQYIISKNTSPNGFIPLPEVYHKNSGILVYAPDACPKNQQADTARLVAGLKAYNLPVTRSNRFSTESVALKKRPTDKEIAVIEKQMRIVMDQASPLVFINGKAKSNPSVTDVVNEYKTQ